MRKDVLEYLKIYLEKDGRLEDKFGTYSRIYSMTTENIAEFINKVDCDGKSVLTVASSGDHTFNTVLNGARNITCFDINPLMFAQVKLKEAAIRTLSFDEFLKFFYLVNSTCEPFHFFDRDLFEKVSTKLDDDIRNIFNFLYERYDGNTKAIKENIYFHSDYNLNNLMKMLNYLNPESYDKLSNILNNEDVKIDFIECDFKELHECLGGRKYDLVLLSNISDYIEDMYSIKPLNSYYEDIMKLTDNLNPLGTMQVGYIYTGPNRYFVRILFADKCMRQEIFTTDRFHTRLVEAYENEFDKYNDAIITYQKFK